jgi:hypothetical protein
MPERCRCSLSAGVPSAVVTDAPHFQQQYASEKIPILATPSLFIEFI